MPDNERFFIIHAASNFARPVTAARKVSSNAASLSSRQPGSATAGLESSDADMADRQTALGAFRITNTLRDGIDTLALGHYMSENGDYSYIATDLLRPFDSFFTTEYKTQATDHSSFKYASQALILLDYSNSIRSPEVKTLAITQYGHALRSVQSCIDDPLRDVSRFKSMLDSIWVMVQVEAKLHTKTSPINCRTHMKGVFDIISSTNPTTMESYRQRTDKRRVLDGVKKLGASLDELTLLSLQTRQAVPQIGSWIEHLLSKAGPPERLSLIASRVPALHASADGIFAGHAWNVHQSLHSLIEDALAVDDELLSWRYGLPEDWTTVRLQEPPWVKHEYLNLPVAILFNQWRVWRIHLFMLIHRCTENAEDAYSIRRLGQARSELQKLAEAIADSANTYFKCPLGDSVDSEPDPDIPSRFIRAAKLLAILLFVKRIPELPMSFEQWLDQRIKMLKPWARLIGNNSSFSTPFPVETGFLTAPATTTND